MNNQSTKLFVLISLLIFSSTSYASLISINSTNLTLIASELDENTSLDIIDSAIYDATNTNATATINTAVNSTSANTALTWSGDSQGANFDFSLSHRTEGEFSARSSVSFILDFIVAQDSTFALSGLYDLVGINVPQYVQFHARVSDITGIVNDLFLQEFNQDRQSFIGGDEVLSLGDSSSTLFDTVSSGALSGVLTAGNLYRFAFSVSITNNDACATLNCVDFAIPTVNTGSGNVQLEIKAIDAQVSEPKSVIAVILSVFLLLRVKRIVK